MPLLVCHFPANKLIARVEAKRHRKGVSVPGLNQEAYWPNNDIPLGVVTIHHLVAIRILEHRTAEKFDHLSAGRLAGANRRVVRFHEWPKVFLRPIRAMLGDREINAADQQKYADGNC